MSRVLSRQYLPAQGAPQVLRPNRVSLHGAAAGPLAEPTLVEMAGNFASATARWAGAGFPVVSAAVYAARAAACAVCPLWDADARLGLGKCQAPGCGCTSFKRYLATERCKHPSGSKWPE